MKKKYLNWCYAKIFLTGNQTELSLNKYRVFEERKFGEMEENSKKYIGGKRQKLDDDKRSWDSNHYLLCT